ncbi:MAG: YHS domain-containing protein [Bryobacterales bacterium]|nr:YHS domain-containing protein [Bryobacterales bacterium]
MTHTVPVLLLLLASALWAGHVEPVNKNSKGVALKGYDPVAYFTESKPVKGDPATSAVWEGATYYFASPANRDLFQASPAKYVPQYGGYCAYAVSKGHTAGISPNAWKIVEGKLYLNHPFAKGKFAKDVEGAIRNADANWPRILAQ